MNNFAAWLCIQLEGDLHKYPEISLKNPKIFTTNVVHLSDMGNWYILFHLHAR